MFYSCNGVCGLICVVETSTAVNHTRCVTGRQQLNYWVAAVATLSYYYYCTKQNYFIITVFGFWSWRQTLVCCWVEPVVLPSYQNPQNILNSWLFITFSSMNAPTQSRKYNCYRCCKTVRSSAGYWGSPQWSPASRCRCSTPPCSVVCSSCRPGENRQPQTHRGINRRYWAAWCENSMETVEVSWNCSISIHFHNTMSCDYIQ